MRVIETTLFQYSELSEAAKQKAREWYCGIPDDFYAEIVIEDAAYVADILGIDLRQTLKTRADKSYSYEPTIFYSGFWSQGDGASFKGQYRYKKGAKKAIRAYAPKDAELHRIADTLQYVQKRNFYQLRADCVPSGRYVHSGGMRVEVTDMRDEYRDTGTAEVDITQVLRDFADWVYKQLETEYEHSVSDDVVAETIEANGYEFTEDGVRA